MFIYNKIPGLTITISGSLLSLIYVKENKATPLNFLSENDLQFLNSSEKNSNMMIVPSDDVSHELCHPPKNATRYNKLYCPKHFGVIPFRQNNLANWLATHCHYRANGENPHYYSILHFLSQLAILTENGNLLHLSKKDFRDLVWEY